MEGSISIIIPLFNKEKFISDTLLSVYKQSFRHWTCLIIDDGSNDNSVKVVEEFILNKPKFKLIIRPSDRKKGASTCRNIGIENSKSKYVQFLDADDLISVNKLKNQYELLQLKDERSIAISKWGKLDKKFELYDNLKSYSNFNGIPIFLNSLIFSKGYFPIHAYLIPRKLIQISGQWNEYLTLNDDGEFIIRILSHSKKIVFAEDAIAWYRAATGSNLSSLKEKIAVERGICSWRLIEIYLQIRYGAQTNDFVDWSKEKFYINVKNSHPDLISKYINFFSKEIEKEKINNNIFNRIKNKINRFF